ncbi:DUF433 domain-containing protein [Limnoraphis robusta Tam1]|uniref:DUF433 domain-containing protein n=1 Tax=Limnoraphis robusta CCNP1315 TaxID=3110306 RepID=A0ABU5TRB1_9CYAN|nr:DUF433 domain-containing protein [Limnoraphis robusta]MEA5498455.1 DUF433 domain-containing protein [Limnoraphis robusta BA-68 BA1]MEA5517421.1 DUF433 domain-containing protein [Limnoraphis robusta CCNP1315]MEA5542396.1 DUF433 domain-containing protein [Limnoraphis robusta Tam1]MEA5545991.1 DUF433 domain-containing protein [Limnoraphis robusta CCNP1324]
MATAARVIQSDPDILGGTPVFVGTRVPMKTWLDYHNSTTPQTWNRSCLGKTAGSKSKARI